MEDLNIATAAIITSLSPSPQVCISGEWQSWQGKVPQIEVETHKVASPDVVVPTLDTVRHEALLYTWLAEHKPLVLCGPPGSGKTMTLFSALRALPDMEVSGVGGRLEGWVLLGSQVTLTSEELQELNSTCSHWSGSLEW